MQVVGLEREPGTQRVETEDIIQRPLILPVVERAPVAVERISGFGHLRRHIAPGQSRRGRVHRIGRVARSHKNLSPETDRMAVVYLVNQAQKFADIPGGDPPPVLRVERVSRIAKFGIGAVERFVLPIGTRHIIIYSQSSALGRERQGESRRISVAGNGRGGRYVAVKTACGEFLEPDTDDTARSRGGIGRSRLVLDLHAFHIFGTKGGKLPEIRHQPVVDIDDRHRSPFDEQGVSGDSEARQQIQHLHHGPVADDRITQHIDFVAACPVFGISGYHDHLVDMSAGRT